MTFDIRIFLYTDSMNEKQKAAFLACIEKIDANGWYWERSFIDGTFQVGDGDVLLGEGVSLTHALEAAESAK
jgi:hypothetical protein